MIFPLRAIILARMGSSRLRGKSLRPICEIPLIFHVIQRLQQSQRITEIVVATSTEPQDTPLADAVAAAGIHVVRGSESDVLSRFALAAEHYKGDYVVRVTGDVPFVDAAAIDRMVDILRTEQADFFALTPGATPIHEGFEVFSVSSLQRLLSQASDDPVAIEHITGYFKAHPEFVSHALVPIPEAESFSGARMSVDTPADIRFVETIYERLQQNAPFAPITDVVSLLKKEPSLLRINATVHQKTLNETGAHITIVFESSAEAGQGHLTRAIALADTLRNEHAAAIKMISLGDGTGINRVTEQGFTVSEFAPGQERMLMDAVLASPPPELIVIDVKDGISADSVKELNNRNIPSALIDDGSDRRLFADMNFYPASPQVVDLDWINATGDIYRGFEYSIVPSEYQGAPLKKNITDKTRILLSMGGSDPCHFSMIALYSLAACQMIDELDIDLVIGAGFSDTEEIVTTANALFTDRIQIHQAPESLRPLMEHTDLAFISFGVTAYEAAAMNLPAVYMCLSADHAQSAAPFVESRIGAIAAIFPNQMNKEAICDSVSEMIMSIKNRRFVENQMSLLSAQIRSGASNVAAKIMERIGEHRHEKRQ
ncbi:MAG: NTP transferase domain-containing protein [Deltaproteobacteria bacterium]|nr:NTP transferase domain-containing protein [Deltaproteobacteria bacterium]MBN2674616.1 NTP transferase domain-containing protein [Deltaproteobacteria bacterium]